MVRVSGSQRALPGGVGKARDLLHHQEGGGRLYLAGQIRGDDTGADGCLRGNQGILHLPPSRHLKGHRQAYRRRKKPDGLHYRRGQASEVSLRISPEVARGRGIRLELRVLWYLLSLIRPCRDGEQTTAPR